MHDFVGNCPVKRGKPFILLLFLISCRSNIWFELCKSSTYSPQPCSILSTLSWTRRGATNNPEQFSFLPSQHHLCLPLALTRYYILDLPPSDVPRSEWKFLQRAAVGLSHCIRRTKHPADIAFIIKDIAGHSIKKVDALTQDCTTLIGMKALSIKARSTNIPVAVQPKSYVT